MRRLIIAVTAFALFLALGAFVPCGLADEVEIVRIGFAAPLTGPSASDGKEMENSAQLAIDDANRRAPTLTNRTVRFELITQDDQGDPRIASQIAQRFSDMAVAGVVGHFNSSCSIAASNVYEAAGIPEVSPSSTSPSYTSRGYKTTFRIVGQDGVAGAVLGRYVVETLRARRIAIIDDRTAFGQGLADTVNDAIGAMQGQVVAREYVTDKTVDFRAVLTRVRSQNPDVVVFGGFDAQAAQLVRQMRSLEMNAKLVGEGFNNDIFRKLARGDGEGTVTIQPGLPMDKLPANDFQKRYAEHFKERLEGFQGPYAYDAATVLVQAVLISQSTAPDKVLAAVKRTRIQGVTGPLAFNKNGDLSGAPYTLYRLDGDSWNVLSTIASG